MRALNSVHDGGRIVAAADQVSTNVDGDAVILNVNTAMYYVLTAVGARVWTLIQEPKSFSEIRDAILAEYAVDTDCVTADLEQLIGELREHGLIQIDACR
jgi:hypothetical protein